MNPIRAKIIPIEKLDSYPWASHKGLLDGVGPCLIEFDEILFRFGAESKSALGHYVQFLHDGLGLQEDFGGGGLGRSLGKPLAEIVENEIRVFDDRVLGIGE